MASGVRLTDGQWDWSAGVDSGRTPTIRSELVPNGLARNQLAWLSNGTVRGGGILCRTGWASRIKQVASLALFQGGAIYQPDFENPYLICSIGGHIFKVLLEAPYTVTDLSTSAALTNPADVPQAFFCQGEQFLVIQAGDYGTPGAVNPPVTDTVGRTLPLFWDGTTLRRSIGILTAAPTPNPGQNELPAAMSMDYYEGRFWYAQGRTCGAGDIVSSHNSGTAPYGYRDSILNVTECPLVFGGDNFSIPISAGIIRAIAHTSNMDSTLGEGSLYLYTRKAVFKLSVPVTRTAWIATTRDNMPVQTVVQNVNGTYSDRSIVSQNGDLYYRAPDGFRGLMISIRYFEQMGNTPLSNNENRIFGFENRALLRFSSGMAFDNRIWETVLPINTPAGVAFQGIAQLDFDIISSFEKKLSPAWEGMQEGLYVLQMWSGDFGGLERAFAMVVSRLTGQIDLWEFTLADRSDDADKPAPDGDRRIVWFTEFPALEWGAIHELKNLDGGEIWWDKVFGTVEVLVEYRVDANPCWQFWHKDTMCVSRSSCEDVTNPVCYPEQPYREGYRWPMVLPHPPNPPCSPMPNRRPMNVGYQFQVRVTVKGWARIRGYLLYAIPVQRSAYEGLTC